MKKVLFLILVLFLVSCTTREIPVEKQCLADGDCVPATCCHATDAVNKDYAPDCAGIFCTQVCEPGTIDCGQGEVGCVDGECQVIIY